MGGYVEPYPPIFFKMFNTNLRNRFISCHNYIDGRLGETFIIEGFTTEYNGVFDEDSFSKDLQGEGDGFIEDFARINCHARIDQFPDNFAKYDLIGKKLTRKKVDGGKQVYRIVILKEDRFGLTFELTGKNK